MSYDFPTPSGIGHTVTGPGGSAAYVWDGVKWAASGSGGGLAYLPLSGGTMTGPLALAGDPTTSPQAANKHYVDQSINLAGNYLGTWAVASNTPNISGGGSISNANYVATTSNPAVPETVPVGVPGIAGMTVANGDRIIWASGLGTWQILRNAGVTLAAADARYYAITNPSGYQTAANVTTALAPYAPLASPALTGNPTAPTPTAGDNDTSVATTAFVASAAATAVAPVANNVGRNLLHNPLFNVAQRGAGPWTVDGVYTADRWIISRQANLDTISFTVTAASDADRAAIGDEAARWLLINSFTGNSGAAATTFIEQRIEGVRRLSGKTVTLSFWATCWAGALKLGINAYQLFGSGGSPSAYVQVLTTGQSVTLSTTWARYSVTLAMPSTAGKTLGTNGDDSTWIRLFYTSAANNNQAAGNIGVQSGGINIWGMQLEIGSTATPLEKPDPQQDLAKCQRFYQVGNVFTIAYASLAGANIGVGVMFPVQMRASPTVTNNGGGTNITGIGSGALSNHGMWIQGASAAGSVNFSINATYTASADL